ncbi:MAG: PIN domain-containing protein [Candidatus Thorarchaeota archaeon]
MFNNVVVIDSNFILLPFQFKIDYFNEICLEIEGKTCFIIYKQILDELEAKSRRESTTSKFQTELKSSLIYLESNKERFHIEIKNKVKLESETTDEFLIKQCINLKEKKWHIFLATNDSKLRKEVKRLGISTIFLRQKKYLTFD